MTRASQPRWTDKTSDRALTHLCLHGLGAHRLDLAMNLEVCYFFHMHTYVSCTVPPNRETDVSSHSPTSHLSRSEPTAGLTLAAAMWCAPISCRPFRCVRDMRHMVALRVVLLNFSAFVSLSGKEKQFSQNLSSRNLHHAFHQGNDAYFDQDFRAVKIVRFENGEVWEDQKVTTFLADGSRDWEYAKFCFRCSLFTLVTLVDHLYGVHLQLANIGVQAMREQLSVDHPVRRFLVPFSYGSININDLARTTLVTRDSWLPRAVALDDEGLQLAWASAFQILPPDYIITET